VELPVVAELPEVELIAPVVPEPLVPALDPPPELATPDVPPRVDPLAVAPAVADAVVVGPELDAVACAPVDEDPPEAPKLPVVVLLPPWRSLGAIKQPVAPNAATTKRQTNELVKI